MPDWVFRQTEVVDQMGIAEFFLPLSKWVQISQRNTSKLKLVCIYILTLWARHLVLTTTDRFVLFWLVDMSEEPEPCGRRKRVDGLQLGPRKRPCVHVL